MAQILRDYQLETNEEKLPYAIRKGHKKVCLYGPCGSGKTTIIADLARRCASKDSTMTVTAHRRRLIKQLSMRLQEFGVRYTVEMADLPEEKWAVVDNGANIVIGSKDTMLASLKKGLRPRSTRVWIPDEAHTIDNDAYQSLGEAIAPEWTIGPTATPCKSDGSGFGPRLFTTIVSVTSIEKLIEQQHLVRIDCYAPVGVNRRRREGLKSGILGDPVRQWIDHAQGLRTITFCRTLAECRAVLQMYRADMIPAEHVDAKTPDEERDAAIGRLTTGETKVLVCTPGLMGVGVDIPEIECVQTLVRQINPRAFWQNCGRAQRTATEKHRAVLIDHAGAVFYHGLPNWSPAWTLATDDSVQLRQQDRMSKTDDLRPVICNRCGTITTGTRCPKCDTVLSSKPGIRTATDRGVVEAVNGRAPEDMRDDDWHKFLYMACAKGWKCIVPASMFKKKWGVWPDKAGVSPPFGFWMKDRLAAVEYPDYVRTPHS